MAYKKSVSETKIAKVDNATKVNAQTMAKSANKTDSSKVKAATTNKSTTAKASTTKVSTSTVVAYYNPVVAQSVVTGGGGGGGSSSPAPVDNTPKIATINKIYSTGENDFVELYNPGDKDFDLAAASYRLEKAKTAEDPSLIMRIGNSEDGAYPGGTVIKAHGSYLIVKSMANSYYLSRAQAIATRDEFSWSGKAYTIYLGTGAISSSTDSDILEAIGFGEESTYYQGSGPAQEIVDNHVLSRIKNTNNNKVDFSLIKSDDPGIDWVALEAALATSTDEVSTSTEEVVTSSDEIVTSTENISSSTEEISTSTEEIDWSKIALINKIYSTGNNEWIELFNPGVIDFDLAAASYRLEKTKTAEDPSLIMRIGNNDDGFYPGGTIIKAGERYLIARDDANPFFRAKASAIATRTDFSWGNSGYTIYLGNGPISSSSDFNIVDLVGYGEGATYWLGNGPASAITNNYILNRVATTSNNNLDFSLIKSDDPGIDWTLEENNLATTTLIYNFSASAYDLFPVVDPINSSGLTNLWHFDDCSGAIIKSAFGDTDLIAEDNWTAGKFACAKEVGYEYGKISGTLNNPIDVNNFSLSFWFKSTMTYPRLSFNLSNNDGDSINITLEDGLMQFSGLPNSDWRYYREFPFNSVWRQATLVVNRNEGYWSLYIDGAEKFHQDSYKMLAAMDKIEIGGNNGPYALDELAIWNRALSPVEVASLREDEAPFNPVSLGEPQKIPVLKHFWNFNEGIGTSSVDLINQINLPIDKNAWSNLDLSNSALNNNWDRKIKVNFSVLKSADLSLTFWWRSLDNYNANRVRVALQNSTANNILTLIPSPYVSGYDFNNFYSYFSYGENLTIPHDLNWHHLALVYDSYRNILKFYVDGALKGSREFVWSANRPLVDGLEIVSEQGNTDIDDLGVWEGALSAGQIQKIFTNN